MALQISGWVDLTGDVGGEGKQIFSKVDMADSGVAITRSVVVTSLNEWYVEVKGRRVPPQSQSLEGAPSTIQSPADINSLLQHVDACNICRGNPDEKYISVAGTGYI